MDDTRSYSVLGLIGIPAIITLAITLLRLTGELLDWAPSLFGRSAGGGGSLVGISWLVPIFGIYFAIRLVRLGETPRSVLVALGSAVGAIVVMIASGLVTGLLLHLGPFVQLIVFGVAAWVAVWIAYMSWPALGKVLLAYAFAARIPVAIVMLVAIYGRWGTHYDVANPQTPQVDTWNPFLKWLAIGALPQFTVWIAFTLAVGLLFGSFVVPLVRRSSTPSTATS